MPRNPFRSRCIALLYSLRVGSIGILFGLIILNVACQPYLALIPSPENSRVALAPSTTPSPEPSATATRRSTMTSTPLPSPTSTDVSPSRLYTRTSTPLPTPTATLTLARRRTLCPMYVECDDVRPRTPTPAPTLVASVRTVRVPILMYHYISVPPDDADPIRRDLSVPPDVFEQEMKFLYDQGFQTIQLRDLLNYFDTGAPLPPKPILLTFDDGYADQYPNAFPTLKDYGFTGTFFIITQFADRNSAGYMTWEQIQELAANGMEIGTHTVDHKANLARLNSSAQHRVIQPARDDLQKYIPNALSLFAYPSGSYDDNTLALLRELGYRAAVTTKQGVMQSSEYPLELKRVRVRGEWTIAQFVYWLDYWMKRN